MEGWGRDKRDLEVLSILRAKNLLLWRIFLSSNQWKCVYQVTVFDLDKCFTDVNKAGERDRGRRDKDGWEKRDRHGKGQDGREEIEGAEIRRDPALPCPSCQRAEIRVCTHPELCTDPRQLWAGAARYQQAGGHRCLPQWDVSSRSRQLLGEQKATGFLKLARVQAGEGARRAGFHGNGSWQERWRRQNEEL